METLGLLLDGFSTSLSLFNIMIVVAGVTAGLFIGAMPGLGSVNGVAIVLPLTFLTLLVLLLQERRRRAR